MIGRPFPFVSDVKFPVVEMSILLQDTW